jgi:hypothetical protein
MLRLVLIGALVFLAGCVGDHGRMGDVNQAAKPIVTPLSPSVTPDQLAHAADEIKTTVQSSTNAAQQSFSGLGAQVAKGAENVDAAVLKFGADVRAVATANLEANLKVTGRIEAVADIVNDLRVDVGLAVNVANRVDLSVKAQADVLADLKMQVAALGAAQVGYKNQLEQTSTSLSSGRDTYMQVTQDTKEWAQILKNDRDAQLWETRIICGVGLVVLYLLLEFSRRRAEARARELVGLLEEFRK